MNNLYFGDNLDILREHIKDESVDLIYLDPPFNSKATYNILFKSPTGHESGSGPGAKRKKEFDHKHRNKTIKSYEYNNAVDLLSDFWAEVDKVLKAKGVIE